MDELSINPRVCLATMDGWMDGWINGWMDKWMGEMDGTDGWMKWMDEM